MKRRFCIFFKTIFFFFFGLWLFSFKVCQAQGQTNLELAAQYFSTGEYDKAAVYYEKQYAADPDGTYESYLRCLMLLKDFKEAERLVKKQMKRNVQDLTLWVDLGKIYSASGNSDKAFQQYDKAIKALQPDVTQVLNLGHAFTEVQETGRALTTYFTGRKMLNGVYPFSFEIAELYAQQGDQQKMTDEYLDLISGNEQYYPNVQAIFQSKISNDITGSTSEMLRASLLRRIQKQRDAIIYSDMLYWLFLQEKDFESALIQAKSMDKKLEEGGGRVLSLGRLAAGNAEYETAEKCFQYVIGLGEKGANYIAARMEGLNASYLRVTKNQVRDNNSLQKLENDFSITLQQLGKNSTTAPLISNYAHLKAFYLNKIDEAISLLLEIINMSSISPQYKAECKLELGDIYIFKNEVWEAALLYGQVDKDFKNDPLGREAKFRNARLSYYLGEFEWAAAQLNVLKAATSQLISNDALSLALLIMDNTGMDSITEPLLIYSRADLLEFRNKDKEALATLDTLLFAFPGHSLTDEAWYKRAVIYEKSQQFDSALVYLLRVAEKYPDDILADDALYRAAKIYETLIRDKNKAMEMYEKILEKYPGSLFAADARKCYRILRGDKIN